MNRVSAYIRQSLQDLYPPQELKSLVMMICCDMLGMDALDIYLGKDINLSESKQHELENILLRLRKNEPIQYIRGVASFLGRPFQVAPGVLIPRPETAELVELIISENKNRFIRILDVGTGSGCIAVSLSLEGYKDVVAWDISDDALAIARTNNEVLGANVLFEKKDVFADQSIGSAKFDIIVSNPPYVTEAEREEMELNVLDWEPELALFVSDNDPLCFYRCIAILGRELLTGEGQLYFEINRAYGVETVSMLTDLGYRNPRIIKDISGNDRIVTAYK
ncbi:peptide chain release factor N(5)-glutamine methyltransferase [Oscillospiraceae bacterium N12]|jgi:release factor glutamine methyltransferase|uniref:peptide chain release factor N(5)-glutamine methyltransferase n=1 Tax=Jilunia laotingensis TaxID=2763675 RepID=A0A926F5F6_9BACT|nr:peptide chain release factor N(5)-glutamine methyltransferase [Jilunia laotingensis]MBC8592249.1 peptide chain release factor N(5)-glutamine methyltransferase [Jilunia laotingensis]